ncbi:hypothetical protein Hanom_Chr04g00335871 [Helianthus anomalus]
MADAMLQEGNKWQLEVNEFHNQAGFLSDPLVDQVELFGSLIRGVNKCPLKHALRTNPVICSSCINAFWNTTKINRQGAGSIEVTIQKTQIIPHHPTLYDQATVLKKLFPTYWRLLVHFFLQCVAENKGGWDQLNKTQTSAVVALVNEWDYNFSAFIFDNMKKIFMLYPRFIQMILDERYPALVKGPNYINLKPMGPGCFENACRNKRAKHHTFEGRYALEKHGRFADVVQGAPVAPTPPVIPVAPVPPPINAQIAKENDIQLIQQVQQAVDDEDEVLVVDTESELESSEKTDSESEIDVGS